MQKANQTEFRTLNVIKTEGNKLYDLMDDISFNSYIDKKILSYKMSSFPEPHTRSKNKINV